MKKDFPQGPKKAQRRPKEDSKQIQKRPKKDSKKSTIEFCFDLFLCWEERIPRRRRKRDKISGPGLRQTGVAVKRVKKRHAVMVSDKTGKRRHHDMTDDYVVGRAGHVRRILVYVVLVQFFFFLPILLLPHFLYISAWVIFPRISDEPGALIA